MVVLRIKLRVSLHMAFFEYALTSIGISYLKLGQQMSKILLGQNDWSLIYLTLGVRLAQKNPLVSYRKNLKHKLFDAPFEHVPSVFILLSWKWNLRIGKDWHKVKRKPFIFRILKPMLKSKNAQILWNQIETSAVSGLSENVLSSFSLGSRKNSYSQKAAYTKPEANKIQGLYFGCGQNLFWMHFSEKKTAKFNFQHDTSSYFVLLPRIRVCQWFKLCLSIFKKPTFLRPSFWVFFCEIILI